MLETLIHIAVLLLLPPLLPGVIAKTKAWFAGRTGPSVFQPYYDIVKCLQRSWVLSETTTWIFWAGPIITLAATLLAGLMVPLGRAAAPIAFTGDLILFAYLFALARFFTTSAALDTGSAFEGMGAAREVTFGCLSEPALFFAFMVLAKISGTLSLTPMLHAPATAFAAGITAPLMLILIGLFIVLLAETCRVPVDDPNTHLELTMIHEAMILDHSGPLYGIILYGSAMKMLVLGSMVLQVLLAFLPEREMLRGPLFLVLLVLLAVVIGIVESVMARLKMLHVPYLLISALLFCSFAFILLIR
ncbi:MAG: hydrogenase [Lentisphaerae bacterium]|jgi:formate hydrogenlyase subunit 4|nr:NADH-quinone oxidoreductase subunit H [Kiritimatiellia bacterium]MDD2349286.1 NADH-quinone oxidoreductase subunit H [Kiritimatiellia bacterium]MDD3584326.1 NADH-quinone oxidoreductase subunit H [Kiritimatiellia bacterium]NLN02411.1 hydrogenase [Lentisphaerota bacterium]HHU16115.1 hydrogenase [Lentisphaerota bacterium]